MMRQNYFYSLNTNFQQKDKVLESFQRKNIKKNILDVQEEIV